MGKVGSLPLMYAFASQSKQASERTLARSRRWDCNTERCIEQGQDETTRVIITIESNESNLLRGLVYLAPG